jgi:tetratricopeptide (TPR) repeat protein
MTIAVHSRRIGVAAILFATAALALLLSRSHWLSLVRTEIGGAAFDRGVALLAAKPQEPNPYLDRALRNYKAAVAWDPRNAHAWRMLGQLYLTLGQNDSAREALTEAVSLRPDQPLYAAFLGDSFDGLGQAANALAAWSDSRVGAIRRDQIAVNLLKQADAHIVAGDPLSAVPTLRDDVLAADPGNLFAAVTIVSAYDRAAGGRHPLADPYRSLVTAPLAQALRLTTDVRYAGYQARAAALAYQGGYWDADMVGRVARLWASQGNRAGVELARAMHQMEPQHDEWTWLLAESLSRAGQPQEALALLDGAPGASQVDVSRVKALVWRSLARQTLSAGDWEQAAQYMLAYHDAAPSDLLALAGLAEAYSRLGQADQSERWLKAYQAATAGADVKAISAAVADATSISLGPDLVVDGGFGAWQSNRPADWAWDVMASSSPWNDGLFVGGEETWAGLDAHAASVQCIWRDQEPSLEPARAGFWLLDTRAASHKAIPVEPGGSYLVSFNYATLRTLGAGAYVWLSAQAGPCWAGDRAFADTGGEWRHVSVVCGPASAGEQPLQALLRAFEPGTVLFDDFQIRQLQVAGQQGGG